MSTAVETIAHGNSSRIAQPRRVLARTAEEWRALWAAHSGPDAAAPEPHVDFDTRMVAGVFAGERPTSGFDVRITGTHRDGSALVVSVEEQRPPDGAMTAQMITSPFHLVSLPRYDGRILFGDGDGKGGAALATSARRRHEPAPSSTGLTPPMAATLSYLAGPFSGALLIAVEKTSRFVKFHAWQSLIGLGLLGVASTLLLLLAFAILIVSPTGFWVMLWLAAITAVAWLGVWAACLVQAYRGRLWKLPLAGPYAERRAGLIR
jgi:uncharacterized membrane protein